MAHRRIAGSGRVIRGAAALLAGALALPGCAGPFPEACRVEVGDDEAAAAAVEEINAIGRLPFQNDREGRLLAVAQRPDLPEPAQIHLVNSVFRMLWFDSARRRVLLALIESPGFSRPARRCILARLGGLTFSSTKVSILDALDAHLPKAPPPATTTRPAPGE